MNKLVVVIDDSPTVRKIIEAPMRRAGYEVIGFADGVIALRWFKTIGGWIPDLILLDIEMPKMDGYQVAQRLKAAPWFDRTVLIVLSRRDRLIDRLKGRLAGAREYHSKPITTQQLVSLAHKYLGNPYDDESQRQYNTTGGRTWAY